MSNAFVIKKKKPVEIKDEEGNILASYQLDVGNHQNLKKWMAKIKDIENIVNKINADANVLDDLVNMEKEIVNMLTGDWDNLWDLCNENVFTMLSIVRFFSEHVREGLQDSIGQYR